MSKAFECQMCGHCCQGEGGIIMTAKDRNRLADHLGISEQALIEKHSETVTEKSAFSHVKTGTVYFIMKVVEYIPVALISVGHGLFSGATWWMK